MREKTKFQNKLDELGIKHEELAEVIGVTPSNISHVVNGKHSPTLDTVIKYCNAISKMTKQEITVYDLWEI